MRRDSEELLNEGGRSRWRRWRARLRAARNQQLLDTSSGARTISASLTTLGTEDTRDELTPGPDSKGHLRVW